jgi:sugar lactone lactonase YvrE
MKTTHFPILLAITGICLSALGPLSVATDVDPDYRRAIIRPSLVELEPGRWQKFNAIMAPRYLRTAQPAKHVKWSVNNIPGGNKTLGTIDSTGLYKAPAKTPTLHEIHICAEVEDADNRHLWATVLLGKPDPPYKLVRTWSQPKDGPKHLTDPHGICLDKDGNLIIADQGSSRVMRFTPQGKFLQYIGSGAGRKPGAFYQPRVVVTGPQGRIWVSDSKADEPRIQVFTPDGKFVRWFAHKGILPGQLFRVHGMEFDGKGRLFIVDVDNFRVNVYGDSGEFLYGWGKPGLKTGTFNAPHGLTVDPSGDVFVSNFFGPTQKFDPNGNLLFTFADADPPDGPVGFHSIAGDRWGNVYMTILDAEALGQPTQTAGEGGKKHILKYNNNGDYITGWSLARPNQFALWLAIDDDGRVYCLFTGRRQMGVQLFAPR